MHILCHPVVRVFGHGRIGAHTLDAEEYGVLQREDIRVRSGIGFKAQILGLLTNSSRLGLGVNPAAPLSSIFPPAALTFSLSLSRFWPALGNQLNEAFRVEVHIGQG